MFSDYYPWAGQDRATTMPNGAVRKGDVLFSHPSASRLAVEHGLRIGQDASKMRKKPGEVMGLFAYGHPFLDGNGRTMLLGRVDIPTSNFAKVSSKVCQLSAACVYILDFGRRQGCHGQYFETTSGNGLRFCFKESLATAGAQATTIVCLSRQSCGWGAPVRRGVTCR